MERNNTKKLAMAGIMIALSQILSYVKVYNMPQGGSVTTGSMVPIILFSLIYGLKDGLFAALVYGLLQFILGGGVAIHPLSILLDYLLGFGVLGLAGVFHTKTKYLPKALIGGLFASVMRYLMVFIAGVVVWGSYAPDTMPVWQYSLTYNGSYMVPEIILTLVVIALVYGKFYDNVKR